MHSAEIPKPLPQKILNIPLNAKRLRIRSIRFFLLLEILLIGFPLIARRDYFYKLNETHIFLISLLLIICLILPFVIFLRSKVSPKIVFKESFFEIPRFFFWSKRIANKSISSVEKLQLRGKEISVLVGQRNGKIFAYDPNAFVDRKDYTFFIECINDIVKQNGSNLENKSIKVSPVTWEQNAILLLFIGGWALLYVYLTQYSESDFYSALEMGAIVKSSFSTHEYYRLVSAFFLHLNTFHLASNILGFAIFGQFMLRLVDRFRFLGIFLLSAFLSALTTLILSPHEAVIGASGGIMGLFGAYCCLRTLRYLPGSVSSSSNISIVLFIILQLSLEYFLEGIDSYTHVAGFATGFIYMAFYLRKEKEHSVFSSSIAEQIGAGLLSIFYLTGLVIFLSKISLLR